ncbi:TolC family protein [Planctomycetota bacterium]
MQPLLAQDLVPGPNMPPEPSAAKTIRQGATERPSPNAIYFVAERREPSGGSIKKTRQRTGGLAPIPRTSPTTRSKVGGIGPSPATTNKEGDSPQDGNSPERGYGLTTASTQQEFPDGLSIADVIASLYHCYPEILQAREEYRRTDGELVSSWGAFDTKLKGYTLNEPTGFYENSRHAIGLARQAWWGGYLSAGYRIGRGEFQPWYKERETDKGGEFKIGWVQPLLQGRAIDLNRVGVFRASLARQATQPIVQQAILESAKAATESYWKWVSTGTVLKAQRELLELAESRGRKFEAGVAAGKFAEIDLILNQQLVAERRGKVLESRRKFQEAAFKLSLYLRDEGCQPIVAAEAFPI